MEFLTWHYTAGFKYFLDFWASTFSSVNHYFSIGLLMTSLFAPWKRLLDEKKESGIDFARIFSRLTFNLVSRGIGFVVRSILIIVGIIATLSVFIVGVASFIFWAALPFLDFLTFLKFKNQPQNVISGLLTRIKNNPGEAVLLIMKGPAGKFMVL